MGILNSDRLIVGYDLGNEYSQISFAVSESAEAQSLSQVAGAEVYNIPTALYKRKGTNQWLFGREALRADSEEGILVENLLSMALGKEPVVIDGENFDPVALLALFFKRSLGLLSQVGKKLSALMVTCSSLNRDMLDVLLRMVEGARLKADRIAVQSYEESFYGYMLRQPKELWGGDVILFDYRRGGICMMRMECNRRTTPIVTFVKEKMYEFPEDALLRWGEESVLGELNPERQQELDTAFLKVAQEVCGEGTAGSVFLIGDGFAQEWMKESLRFLCKGRRVFQGNNLFSKGACCGMQERIMPGEMGKTHVFLGNDKLKANIGIRLFRQGEESYYALLDAGENWYEAEHVMELYLQEGNELALTITPLAESQTAGRSRLVRIILEGLPGKVSRLGARFFLKEENRLSVEVKDLGFGEYRVSSGRVWKEEIEIG
ncbi:DUF5716 family protein [Acetatifactor aquisgranensis]|uniref:DUF5716 family protein n=1 Tax=Acetatifactor aquisgranensis TaxID=2941233 RepID=UPI00203DC716|nr:DUF5716 family protein [Acetatifactor aquisgranensis]MCI8541853.1 hypothetical protein [Lachnospiraceae bacterium]